MPDGTIIEGVPEGTTQAQVMAKYQGAKPDMFTQTAEADSNTDNFLASVGGALAGIPIAAREIAGKPRPGEFDQWKQSMAGLWSTPMGKAGSITGGVLPAVPLMMAPGLNTIAGAAGIGAVSGALQPTGGEDGQRARNTALGFGLGGLGQAGGNALGSLLSNRAISKAGQLSTAEAQNAVRDATIREGQAAGFTFPPDQINPSLINRGLVGLSGKISTAQGAAIKNQELIPQLVKKELGLPADVPLNKETLQQVRSTAGEAYKTLKQFGPVKTDAEFTGALQGLTGEYRALVNDFPSQRNAAIESLVEDLSKPQFNSASAVELVKRLRSDGRANLKAFDDPAKKALGKVQIGAQSAIEDLLERNLIASGNAGFLQIFRNARTMIAKTHTIEDALEDSTGHIVASKIGKEYAKGRPLTGELATIGKVAQAFPRAVQNVNTSMPGLSPLDYMAGLVSGNAAAALARPAARGAILSGPYQRAMVNAPSYEQNWIGQLLAANKPQTEQLTGLLGGAGLPAWNRP